MQNAKSKMQNSNCKIQTLTVRNNGVKIVATSTPLFQNTQFLNFEF
jgi:hypothetical protein